MPTPKPMTKLRALRLAAGLSQRALGTKVALDSTSIAHLEAGRFIACEPTARRIGKFFGVAAETLHESAVLRVAAP